MRFLSLVADQIALAIDNALAYSQIAEFKEKLTEEKLYLEEEIRSEINFEDIVGDGPTLRRALQQVETVAATDSTVLLLGETGSGKELIARAIHTRSKRYERTFVKLNCAAIPTGLLESELFGHERGAFTGAIKRKVGRVELADRGTLFLDEVGDIPLELQPKLLRGAAGTRVRAAGQQRNQESGRAPDRRDAPRPAADDSRRQLSQRPFLPPQCLSHPRAAFARAARGYSSPWCGTSRRDSPSVWRSGSKPFPPAL